MLNNGRIYNISIPDSARGSHSFTLAEPSGLEFIATMYDSTGWGTGGTTPVLSESIRGLVKHLIVADMLI
jgi:hypothetical protein